MRHSREVIDGLVEQLYNERPEVRASGVNLHQGPAGTVIKSAGFDGYEVRLHHQGADYWHVLRIDPGQTIDAIKAEFRALLHAAHRKAIKN